MSFEPITQGGKLVLENTITVFVSPNGSDETGLGTKSDPFATPDFAVVWANLNCEFGEQQDLLVQIAPGTYDAVQIYGHSARQVYLVGDPYNPGKVVFKVMREEAEFALSVAYYSQINIVGVDIASALATGFSNLTLVDCWLNPAESGNDQLLAACDHSSIDFETGTVKAGEILGDDGGLGTCYDCELHSHIQVGTVDYEATVECDTFCDARFCSSIFLYDDPQTKGNIKSYRAARAVTQSIVCDSDYLPAGEVPNLASSGGVIDNLADSELTEE